MEKYERINLDEYVQTGEGGTAVSYIHREAGDTLVKLYNPGFEADKAQEEFQVSRTVYEMGIPTPEPYRLVTDGTRYGAEYELVKDKRSYARIISQEPERMEELSLDLAAKARELHATKADTTRLSGVGERIRQFYRETKQVPEAFKQRALAFLEHTPETQTCLHGDLQLGNIITDGKRTLWIDVGEFSYGCPEWDLCTMWAMAIRMRREVAEQLLHLTPEQRAEHWNIFLSAYLQTKDPQVLEAYVKRLMPFYALKSPYMVDMARHQALPEQVLQFMFSQIPEL